VPGGTKTLALVMEGEETARGILTHWIIFNINPRTRYLSEDCVPSNAQMGANSWGECCYDVPHPISDEHQYFFRLNALDCGLNLAEGANRIAVEKAMKGHIVSEAVLLANFRHAVGKDGKSRP
jgi:Raf kinase inhibitor-like YbhB/YbcL family protein